MRTVFWVSTALVFYTYLGYAVVLLLLAGVWQVWHDLKFGLGRGNRRRVPSPELPFVSLVFAAHNEEKVIGDKIRNCLAIDYPAGKLEIVVGCDGCEDRTSDILSAMRSPNLRIFNYRGRSGKPRTLNRLVPEARGGIIVFSDANTMFTPGAVRALVRHFSDESAGCVCGALHLEPPGGGDESEGAYWRYESFLKFLESRLNMMVGANGGIFAIRHDLYTPLPDGTVTDDFLISMQIRQKGWLVRYDPEAVAWEETSSLGQEFRRRVRIGAGNVHALRHTWKLLSPAAGLVSLSYWSHKIFRWLAPFAIIAAFVSSVLLAPGDLIYAFFAGAAVWFLLTGLIGWRLERGRVRIRLLSIPCYFLSLNLALLCGVFQYFFGGQRGVWRPTARAAAAAEASDPPQPGPDSRP